MRVPEGRIWDPPPDGVLVAELKEFMQARGRCRFVGYLPGKSALLGPQAGLGTGEAFRRAQPAGPDRAVACLLIPGTSTAPALPVVGGPGVAAPRTTGGMDQ